MLQVLNMERYRSTYSFSRCVLSVPLPPWGVFSVNFGRPLRLKHVAPRTTTHAAFLIRAQSVTTAHFTRSGSANVDKHEQDGY